MKCFNCVCAMEDENGEMWCVKYKMVPNGKMADECTYFLNREEIFPDSVSGEECQ